MRFLEPVSPVVVSQYVGDGVPTVNRTLIIFRCHSFWFSKVVSAELSHYAAARRQEVRIWGRAGLVSFAWAKQGNKELLKQSSTYDCRLSVCLSVSLLFGHRRAPPQMYKFGGFCDLPQHLSLHPQEPTSQKTSYMPS